MYEVDTFSSGISNWEANSSTYCADTLQIHQSLCNTVICFGNNFITLHMWNINWLACAMCQFLQKLIHQCRSDDDNEVLQIMLTEFQPKMMVFNATSSAPHQNI